jgi:hypothetical protein
MQKAAEMCPVSRVGGVKARLQLIDVHAGQVMKTMGCRSGGHVFFLIALEYLMRASGEKN